MQEDSPLLKGIGSGILAFALLVAVYISLADNRVALITGFVFALLALIGIVAPKTPIGRPLLTWATDRQLNSLGAAVREGFHVLGVAAVLSFCLALAVYIDFLSVLYAFGTSLLYVIIAVVAFPKLFWDRKFAGRTLAAILVTFLSGATVCVAVQRGVFSHTYETVRARYPNGDLAFPSSQDMTSYIAHYERLYSLNAAVNRALSACRVKSSESCQRLLMFPATGNPQYLPVNARPQWYTFASSADESIKQAVLESFGSRLDRVPPPSGPALIPVAAVAAWPRLFACVSAAAKVTVLRSAHLISSLDSFSGTLALALCLTPLPLSRLLQAWSRRYDPQWRPEGHMFLTIIYVIGLVLSILGLRGLM